MRHLRSVCLVALLVGALVVATSTAGGGGNGPAEALQTGNLIANPGAEVGAAATTFSAVVRPPSWQTTSNFTQVGYAVPDSPPAPAGGGLNYFAGGPSNPLSTATQVVDVASSATAIDAGRVRAGLSALIGGFSGQGDSGTVDAIFLSASDAQLGQLRVGPVTPADRGGRNAVLPRSGEMGVPRTTRKIRVVMTATRSSGDYNDGYFDNLSLTLTGTGGGGETPGGGATPVGTSFDGGTTSPSIDLGRAPEPPVIATETSNTAEARQLVVSVLGNGVVTATGRTFALATQGAISCGVNQFLCYARLEPQQRVTLRARPSAGYVFRAWTGACAGQGPKCTVAATALRTVTAVFAPRNPGAAIALNIRSPRFSVRWAQSVGSGSLAVRGNVGRSSRLLIQLRRPGGGSLLFKFVRARGAFSQTLRLIQSRFPLGATLLPGGFVVSVTGVSEGFQLPLQLRTVVLPSPREGVVRQAFPSATKDGGPTLRFPSKTTEVWANFRFATQPLSRLPVTVTWYFPNGRKIGTVVKPNQPEVDSGARFAPGLPNGLWVAELRAGGKISKRLSVRIG